jgi:hypothetical protein
MGKKQPKESFNLRLRIAQLGEIKKQTHLERNDDKLLSIYFAQILANKTPNEFQSIKLTLGSSNCTHS